MLRTAALLSTLMIAATAAGKVPRAVLHSEAAVDAILASDPTDYAEVEIPALPSFKFPLKHMEWEQDGFEELNFLVLSEKMKAKSDGDIKPKTAVESNGDEDPIQCETVCRPMSEAGGAEGEEEEQNEESRFRSMRGQVDEDMFSLLQIEMKKHVCDAKNGEWDDATQKCESFMKSSKAKLSYEPKAVFETCRAEHGPMYVPCNPYQALALAHTYEVPDHSYYWLWPGGRHDQVHGGAAMKQGIGNNPESGMDTCPEEQHVGFFHNWDEAHVDSWGCLHESQEIPVLCCRRG
jgi:hypothetical protein